jgi:protein gp37
VNKTGIPYLDFGWNPCGFGCSKGCDGCWAAKMVRSPAAPACPDCRAFRPHFHPERLTGKQSPSGRGKPAVIGVQFTGDLFDPQRLLSHDPAVMSPAGQVLEAMHAAPQHTYVLLTQQPSYALARLNAWLSAHGLTRLPDNWFVGATVRTAAQATATFPYLLSIPGRLWLSLEPLAEALVVCQTEGRHVFPGMLCWGPDMPGQLAGVVIGEDNCAAHACGIQAVRVVARQVLAAGVPLFVKQLWMWQCPRCRASTVEAIAGHRYCHSCMLSETSFRRVLVDDPALFPADLRHRQLPWTLATKDPMPLTDRAATLEVR